MAELEHRFQLYPGVWWLADEILKRNGFPTSEEQSAMKMRSRMASHEAFVTGNGKSLRACDAMAAGYGKSDPVRDLQALAADGMDVVAELTKAKASYNELFLQLRQASPKYMDLTWQILRRFGHRERFHDMYRGSVEDIINPKSITEEEKIEMRNKYFIPAPTTDDERIEQSFMFYQLPSDARKILGKEPPQLRLVEFDADYFYNTGRFAFAFVDGERKGDIFQTIWDFRQQEAPLFKI